ncbi:MAG: deoxyribodipyrimidine photo-lyase [Candidatus Zixiibacteriota bacterium]
MNIDSRRIYNINDGPDCVGPVIYLMARDSRVSDNWALLFAQNKAIELKQPLIVAHTLTADWPEMGYRQYRFLLDGLKPLANKLAKLNISFTVLEHKQAREKFIHEQNPGAVIVDFNPLRESREWKRRLADRLSCAVYEVDAHNIVPAHIASPKLEYAAYTIRPKINKLLPDFLTPIPPVKKHPNVLETSLVSPDWEKLESSPRIKTPFPVWTFASGEEAGESMLDEFLTRRLRGYHERRNDANAGAVSNLSTYLHFGFISAQRVAFEAQRFDDDFNARDTFLEELIVRRELSDNFCLYNENYDSFTGFPEWAQKSLDEHRSDPRKFVYSPDEFENARTHDPLWNAAQIELLTTGKMHGYLRMFWAKKILEWSVSPEDAQATALYLNDMYALDGYDPNGFTGVAWSIGGVHDRPWFERDIFGKVRYMAESGCKKKFDIPEYIKRNSQASLEIGS